MLSTASLRLAERGSLLLGLLLLGAATTRAQPALGSGRGGIVPVLEGRDARTDRVEVDSAIASAIGRERVGDHDGAVSRLQAVVHSTGLSDAKARYFLARAYLERAKARGATNAAGARQDRALALVHLRAVPGLARTSPLPEDAQWAKEAQARLRARARSGPLLDQNTAGGSYPWGYCGIASLRMVLRLEGLPDPGADVVALRGAAPYSPGAGSDPTRLAARARELGLQGASYTNAARLADLTASIDQGRPVLVAGVGPFSATVEGGGVKARSYPSGHWLVAVGWEADAQGKLTRVVLNDPDGGRRLSMTRAEFLRFFAPEGDGAIWAIRYAR